VTLDASTSELRLADSSGSVNALRVVPDPTLTLPEIERDASIEAWSIDNARVSLKRGDIQLGLCGNIAANLAGKTIVRSP
jgi:hypothetical protein